MPIKNAIYLMNPACILCLPKYMHVVTRRVTLSSLFRALNPFQRQQEMQQIIRPSVSEPVR